MTTGVAYVITMKTGFALSIDGNNVRVGGQLILNNRDPSNPYQLWTPVFYPATMANILLNPGTGFYAAPQSLDNGAPVILFSLPGNLAFDAAHTWQIVGKPPFAVRSAGNTDRNLNAKGNTWKQGTPIIVYDWGGGADNEVWNFAPQKIG